ncbi:HPt (histidine-containing phosphotransfer) domain-containing protein [Brevundimonas sp. 1080]|uniref:Hpt domain-containing protein n=1 Tax=Brevundimonas sp. 1080 TaxID=3156405 RepID=UPI003397B4F2
MTDVLATLRARFLERCEDDVARLQDLLAQDDLGAELMRGLVHSLSGAAGTFGFPEISLAAGAVDDVFAVGGTPSHDEVDRLIRTMEAALVRPEN